MARETIVFRDNMQYADDAAFFAAWPGSEVGQVTHDLVTYDISSIGPRWTDGIKTLHMELIPAGIVVVEDLAWEFRTRTISGLNAAKRYVVRAAFHMDANYPFKPRAGIEVRGGDGPMRRAYSILADGTDYLAGDRTNEWEILEIVTRPTPAGQLVIALGAWVVTGIMPRQTHFGLIEIAELANGPADDFMLDPDGAFPVIETVAYLTDILTGRSGHEQRRMLRGKPRLRLEFVPMRFDDVAASMDAQLHANLSGDWFVPWWTDQSPLTADVNVGATVIPCATTGYRFAEGEEIVLWRSPSLYERRVVAVGGLGTPGQITVTASVANAWTVAGGTLVMPVKRCRLLEERLDVARPASFVSRRPLVFETRI